MEPLGDSQVTRDISSRMGLVLSACRFPGAAQAHGLLEMQKRTGDRHMLGGKCGQEDCVLPPRVVRSHGNIRWKYFSCTKRRAFLFRFSFPVGILPAVSKRQSQVSLKMHEGISHRTGYPEAEDSQDCSALWFNDVLESLWLLSATYWMTHLRVMYWLQWFQTLHPYHITCCLQRGKVFSESASKRSFSELPSLPSWLTYDSQWLRWNAKSLPRIHPSRIGVFSRVTATLRNGDWVALAMFCTLAHFWLFMTLS